MLFAIARNIVVALGSGGEWGYVWMIPELARGEEVILHTSFDEVIEKLQLVEGRYPFGINIDPQNQIETDL